MPRSLRLTFTLGAAVLAAAPLLAAPADQIQARIAGYRELGEAFKAVNDGLRRGGLAPADMVRLADRIAASGRAQYSWFPAGSGSVRGVKTAAKPEIWSRAAEFRATQDRFAQQAQAFRRVAASGDAAALRTASRQLGASCKSCHDIFRIAND
jgi:cytochrome c556